MCLSVSLTFTPTLVLLFFRSVNFKLGDSLESYVKLFGVTTNTLIMPDSVASSKNSVEFSFVSMSNENVTTPCVFPCDNERVWTQLLLKTAGMWVILMQVCGKLELLLTEYVHETASDWTISSNSTNTSSTA